MKTKMVLSPGVVIGFLSLASVQAQETQTRSAIEFLPPHFLNEMTAQVNDDFISQDQHVAGQRTWPVGQTVKVCFFYSSNSTRELIAKTAAEWSKYANLNFDFGPEGARRDCGIPGGGFSHIRVGFDYRGYWSLVGTDSVTRASQYEPSLNLQSFDVKYGTPYTGGNPKTLSPSDRGTVLHEFGHAMGLLHDHQNANLNCWNELRQEDPNSVYSYYGAPPNNWNRDRVRRNLGLALWSDPDSVSGKPDVDSIMAYFIPAQILLDGTNSKCFIPEENDDISQLDKEFVAKIYPFDQLEENSETESAPYSIATPILVDSPALARDYKQRIIADLNSDITAIRRDARTRLSELFVHGNSDVQIEDFTRNLSNQSYRSQLGIAVAIDRVRPQIILSDEAAANIRSALSAARAWENADPTLLENLEGALDAEGQ